MTIIAAFQDASTCAIGCDTAAISGTTLTERGSKLIEYDNFTIAFTGSYRAADLIREDADSVIRNVIGDNFHLGTMGGLAALRDAIKYVVEQELGPNHEATFLLVSPYGIFSIEEDYQIHKLERYAALGAGEDYALGALYYAAEMNHQAKPAVRRAIDAAKEHCSNCGGKTIVKTYERVKSQ